MQSSIHSSSRKIDSIIRRLFALLVIAAMIVPIPQLHAETVREIARRTFSIINGSKQVESLQQGQDFQLQPDESPSDRASRVTLLRLCPRNLSLYVGESFTLVPLPLDHNKDVVHGVGLTWSTNNPDIANVTSWGEVSAVTTGHTVVTVQAGVARAKVVVEVRGGRRPLQSDLEWDIAHGQDCDEPESSQLNDSTTSDVAESDFISERAISRESVKALARPASLRVKASSKAGLPKAAGSKIPRGKVFPVIDPDGSDTTSPAAAQFNNAVGSPRFTAQEEAPSSPTKTRRQLGSYNYLFTAPVLNLGGRGVGVDLALSYNSRLWNKDGSQMTFNYNKGWPAAGWTLGYGRVIKNYDDSDTGDSTGVGQDNRPGNRLLIQPDGTRVHLQQTFYVTENQWEWDTTDGTFVHMNNHDRLRYPDGTLVQYNEPNNRLVPTSIKNSNGDLITIAYRTKTSSFPYRWAIDFITDTLGRVIQFKYYGDSGYAADAANGKPQSALAAITAPNFGGAGTRTLVQIDYQDITLNYNFGSMMVIPPSSSILTVVKRIYYPQTGRGFLFQDFSTYGMARKISARKDMTGTGGTITDGTEISYTTHNYTTIDPADPYNRNQSGALNDSPQYTQRGEWWQGKTDDNGNADPNPTIYGYSRTTGGSTQTDTITYPGVTGGQLSVVTTSDAFTGFVSQVEYKNSATVLGKTVYAYTAGPDGGSQIATIETFDEANTSTKIEYGYENYGRIKNFYEYGYKDNGTFKVRRRTRYFYLDTQAYLDENLLRVLTEVRIYDGLLNNDNNDDIVKTKAVYSYDNYAVKGGMENYGLTSGTYPPNHDSAFNQSYTIRGNLTGVQTFSAFGTPDISTTRYTKYDIFGNAIEADVSCCQVKTIKYKDDSGNAPTYYSQPMSVITGRDGVAPFLKTKHQYDFNTGLETSETDPNNLTTAFAYDTAWRPLTVTKASGAVVTTQFDRDANGNDQLAYSEKLSYTENGTSRVVTKKGWFDGAGRVLRSGSGAGTSPINFDVVASVYDRQGRALKQSNPYVGDSSGNGSSSYWTTNSYDLLSRVTQVKLPDNQTVTTSYTGATGTVGATVTVTDQVNRKKKSEADGLGRVVKVTEQDTATGSLTWATSYAYDVLDNLTGINQNNQTRTYVYDVLSRMTSQTTPEAGTVSFAYTDFDAVKKRVDARGVETHYKYDSLNRMTQVWYTGSGGDDAGSLRPALPAGVAATSDVTLSYNNFSTSQVGNGQVSQVTDAAGTEIYSYDSLGRLSSRTRGIDARSYQLQYLYNTANQLTTLVYPLPTNKRVRMNHDTRGRMSGLDKVDSGGTVLSTFLSGMNYNEAGQVTGLNLGNGTAESYGYSTDGRMQLVSQNVTKAAATLMSLSYGYGATAGQMGAGTTAGNGGQLVSISGTVSGQTRNQGFTYDNVGRLLTASAWSAQGRRYGYDQWGNRTGMWNAVSGGTQIQAIAIAQTSSVANNRIANVNGVGYSYDASGNLLSDGAHSYSYDGEGRLASVDGGSTASYTYDGRNWRVKKVSGGVTTHCVWEGSEVIAEYNGATGAVISEYIYAGGRMLARDQAGVMRYYHQDRLSTRMITDGSGTVVGTMDHYPFGEDVATGSGESEKHRFTSYERDAESGTDYAVNRQHHMVTGRFMRPDPVAGSITSPQSFNRYAYAANDPINGADPLGLLTCFIDGVQTDCGSLIRLIENGDFERISYTVNGVTRTVDRNSFYESINPSTDPDSIRIGTTFNNTAFESAIRSLVHFITTDGSAPSSSSSPFGEGGDFGGAGATDMIEEKSVLFRGDRPSNPPDVVCKEGFKPKGSGTDLSQAVATSTYKGNFVMTSKSRSVASGFVRNNGFLYIIDSGRGIDVNVALGSKSPYPEQQIVAIPGGIYPKEVVGAFVIRKGKVTDEFIRCKN